MGGALVAVALGVIAAPGAAQNAGPAASIVFDGDMSDWPDGADALATDRWMYFRYQADQRVSLQNGAVMTVLQIDLDSDASTGVALESPGFGMDLEVAMTTLDQRDPSKLGGGVEINAFGPAEQHESLSHMRAGFSFLPTYASDDFEIRMARDIQGPPWLESLVKSSGKLRYRYIHRDALYQTSWTGDIKTLDLPRMTPGRERFSAVIPAKEGGSVRIVSWNVLWGSPSKTPDPFVRVLRALDPDVINFQEWDNGYWTNEDRIPERDYVDWLNTHLGGSTWSVRRGAERGVLVASRHKMSGFLPEEVIVPAGQPGSTRGDHVIRCASALVETPAGGVGAVSIHLKSRGSLGSIEDKTRIAEVSAVHDAIRSTMASGKPDFLIVTGDWNLVGGREPLERGIRGIDFDGSDLLVVEPRRLGIGDAVTWRDQRSPFAPGRLDYALIADDGVEVVRSFLLDTSLLDDASLNAAKLRRADTDSSDHLPLVVDLRNAR